MDDEIKDLRKGLTDILVAIGRLDEQMKNLSAMSAQLQDTTIKVAHMEQSMKTAYVRLDELRVKIETVEKGIEADKRFSKDDRKWLLGALSGVVALAFTIISHFGGGQ